ncbi:hypothetical protein D3C77_320830 [compost metagenome]
MRVQKVGGVDRHRTVQVDGRQADPPGLLQPPDVVQERLGPADGEGGDDHGPAARGGSFYDLAQGFRGVPGIMAPITIGRFHDHIVGLLPRLGIDHGGVAITAEITGEEYLRSVPGHLGGSRPEDVPRAAKGQSGAARQLYGLMERGRDEALHRASGVVHAIERQGRLVLAVTVTVCLLGVLLLDMAAVAQDDLRHIPGGGAGQDGPAESILDQFRQVAGVVQVGVGQDHRVNARGLDRERGPVLLAQGLEALEQAAVDQDAATVGLEQVF